MNKKEKVLFFVFFIGILFFSSSILAQVPEDIAGAGLEGDAEKILGATGKLQGVAENLSDEDIRSEYLKQEWTKLLEKSKGGRALLVISGIFNALSPVFKLFIGIGYSLSWMFFLSLFFWALLIVFFYRPIKEIFQGKLWISLLISLILAMIAAQTGIIQSSLNFLSGFFVNGWAILIGFLVGLVVAYLYLAIMKKVGAIIRKKLKIETEERQEMKAKTVEKLHDVETKAIS